MNAKEKNRLAGIFLMAHGGLTGVMYLLMGAFFGLALAADPNAPKVILGIVAVFVVIAFVIFALPQFLAGWKMYKEEPNAKTWGLVGSIFACLTGFLGIGAGVFALVFLFGEEGKRFYDSLSGKNYLNPANPVDDLRFQNYQQQQPREPHSWK